MQTKQLDQFYDAGFYSGQISGSVVSARAILKRLYEAYLPESVVDFGCGQGSWLTVAESLGSKILKGYDGGWVDGGKLLSKNIDFVPVNMEEEFHVDGRFDLAISVEVAEHLSEARAKSFVGTLCKASDVVVFGAAIRHQGGTHHINEQWQSYWIELFRQYGYDCYDIFRGAIWDNADVDWWYRQNTFLFLNGARAHDKVDANALRGMEKRIMVDVVHPENYDQKWRYLERCREELQRCKERIDKPTLRFCFGTVRRYLYNRLGIQRREADEK